MNRFIVSLFLSLSLLVSSSSHAARRKKVTPPQLSMQPILFLSRLKAEAETPTPVASDGKWKKVTLSSSRFGKGTRYDATICTESGLIMIFFEVYEGEYSIHITLGFPVDLAVGSLRLQKVTHMSAGSDLNPFYFRCRSVDPERAATSWPNRRTTVEERRQLVKVVDAMIAKIDDMMK